MRYDRRAGVVAPKANDLTLFHPHLSLLSAIKNLRSDQVAQKTPPLLSLPLLSTCDVLDLQPQSINLLCNGLTHFRLGYQHLEFSNALTLG